MTSRTTLKSYFETGDIPTQSNFADLIDSLLHADDRNTANGVVGLDSEKRITLQTPAIDLTGGVFGGSVITINPLDGEDESEPFIIGTYSSPFHGGVRDHIMVIGCTAPGRMYDQWEQLFQQYENSRLVERHIIYTVAVTAGNRTVGDQVRLDSYTYDYSTNFCDYYQTISQYSIKDLNSSTLDVFFSVNRQGNVTLDNTTGSIPKQGIAISCNSEGSVSIGATGAATVMDLRATDLLRCVTSAILVAPTGVTPDAGGGYWNLYLKKPTGGIQIESTQFGNGWVVVADLGVYGTYLSNGRNPVSDQYYGQAASDSSKAVDIAVGGSGEMFSIGNYPGGVRSKRLSINSSGNTVIDGLLKLNKTVADGDADTNCFYLSSTQGKLAFKDAGGTVRTFW